MRAVFFVGLGVVAVFVHGTELMPWLAGALAQGHWFEFEIDQSYLPATVAQLEAALRDPT